MSSAYRLPNQTMTMGLLPQPKANVTSFFTSAVINGLILLFVLLLGLFTHRQLVQHHYEQMVLITPATPPPPPKLKIPAPPKLQLPEPPKMELVKLQAPKIVTPRIEPKPEPKPIELETKTAPLPIKEARPNVILAPQPKAALAQAAAPSATPQARPSTAAVHLGSMQGVAPNPNASRPATIAAIGNPYGGMSGAATAPHGVVGSTGIGNGTQKGSNSGVVGKVASAGIPGAAVAGPVHQGKVAAANIPVAAAPTPVAQMAAKPVLTNLEVLSKPPVQYTAEARQNKVQGDVVLRVTFTASGQVVVQSIVRGLGHGLDEEARRVAQQIRFRPATRNGQAVDTTTNITITFQLA